MHETNLNEIILCAAQGRELDGYGDLTDLHLHTCLSQLYADYNSGKYDLEQCKALKEKLVNAWKSDKQTEAEWRDMLKRNADMLVASNERRTALHKADSLRDFAENAAVIIELVCGEVGLVKKVSELQ